LCGDREQYSGSGGSAHPARWNAARPYRRRLADVGTELHIADTMAFLPEFEPRPLTLDAPAGITACDLFVGQGGMALEIALCESPTQPTAAQVRELHRTRVGRRAAPVLVVVLWGEGRAALCGGPPDDASVETDLDRDQVERLCRAALNGADRHAAIRYLAQALPQLTAPIPGLRNEGLFALHELSTGVRRRGDWETAIHSARPALTGRGRALVDGLGFQTQPLPGPASLLLARGSKTAVAVFLERPDLIDPPSPQFDGLSPVSYALAKADHERLDYVVVSAGSVLRIYPVKPGVGTGRRGRTETFVELNLDLLRESDAGYLWLLCSADALADRGSFSQILASSEEYAADLSTRLRERVYVDVVPGLARAIAAARTLDRPTAAQLAETYDMALLVLFRLLFIAYAEDKELLPLHSSPAYREHSLKHMALRLADEGRRRITHAGEDFYWTEVGLLWKAVDKGNPAWAVPAYNGGLFAEHGDDSAARLRAISLPDAAFAPVLAALLLDQTPEGDLGPIDFRSLGVREFGTIYEGLLESELSLAETDLTVQPRTGAYLPAGDDAVVSVPAGEVYLHNASGARKSTGAYYTKSFAVEHLLDAALEPALDDHFARLDALDDRQAADRLFEFRVADIAMGSGHFLVAAIDRIERRFSNYLAARRLPGVSDELERLRGAALKELGEDWAGEPLEDTQLLRRQIARRCVFGVDLNPLAVELARLSIWIHTFVPGLPLSLLDQNLVIGNSLVGIATFDEAADILAGGGDLFSFTAEQRLRRARDPLRRLGRLADATTAEVQQARELYETVKQQTRGEAALLTILAASRIDPDIRAAVDQGQIATLIEGEGDVFTQGLLGRAEDALAGLNVLHFPIEFPQVFLGDRGGFDVIIGNPPWQEATIEEDMFWSRYVPGGFRRSLRQRDVQAIVERLRQERPDLYSLYEKERDAAESLRRALTGGDYPGMGTGDPDLYKAFVWRFWRLVSSINGRIAVVLPRSALVARGSGAFRKEIFARARRVEITLLVNAGGWVFDDAEHRYTIGLVTIERGVSRQGSSVRVRGPFSSFLRFQQGQLKTPTSFQPSEVEAWTDAASLPMLPNEDSLDVFAQLRQAPRLDCDDLQTWRVRPYAELHATSDKPLMDLTLGPPDGYWPVYKGESFDLWQPDTGTYYGWADPDIVIPVLQGKRQSRSSKSAFAEFSRDVRSDPKTLACLRPRIAFRDATKWDNQRTLIAALIPPHVFCANQAPFLLWPRGGTAEEAYLLGVLSSLVLDWYVRRFVETHVSFFLFNPLPVPRPEPTDRLSERIINLSARLAAPDDRFADWARDAGVEWGALALDQKEDMIRELDAVVAHLYRLKESQLVHIFETFHIGWDYHDRLDATLRHYRNLKRLA
jgi:hypothetical protein